MNTLRLTVFLVAIALIVGWRMLFQGLPLLPVGALMVFPLIYYRWFSTLLFALAVGLVWESATPVPFGAVALPLAVGCVIMQMTARHQFRSSIITRIVCAVLLQSIVTLAIGLKFPPKSLAGAGLQLFETLLQLLGTMILCPLWLWGIEKLSREGFGINLESRLKDL